MGLKNVNCASRRINEGASFIIILRLLVRLFARQPLSSRLLLAHSLPKLSLPFRAVCVCTHTIRI